VLKAGELPPPLGEMKTEGLSPLLVKVNQVIKPVRFNESRSLHFYSEYEGLQFDKESTMKWYRRFDEASALLDKEEMGKSCAPERIKCWTDEIAPHAGQWAAMVNGTTEYIQTREGQKMPPFEDKYGKQHRACWKLLKRDDNGSVYTLPE
ncbi:TPA: type VI immunity family protein, partial [Escherichia coli]